MFDGQLRYQWRDWSGDDYGSASSGGGDYVVF